MCRQPFFELKNHLHHYLTHALETATLARSADELTSRSVFEAFQQVQMVDVHLPATDRHTILLQRFIPYAPLTKNPRKQNSVEKSWRLPNSSRNRVIEA